VLRRVYPVGGSMPKAPGGNGTSRSTMSRPMNSNQSPPARLTHTISLPTSPVAGANHVRNLIPAPWRIFSPT